MLVSVIVPTYKQIASLKKAIHSLLIQNYQNIEIIIVDDNYDADFSKKVESMINAIGDKRITYIRNELKLGSAMSRNKGVFISRGEYITFLDDDDIFLPGKIDKQLNYMHLFKLDYSVCDIVLVNENDKVKDVRKRRFLSYKKSLFKKHIMYHITATSTFMFKSQFLKNIGGFDRIDLGDEFYLMAKAISNSDKFGHLEYIGVRATIHRNTGLSASGNKITAEKNLLEFKKTHFGSLSKGEIRYILMRHNLVLASAHLKGRRPFKFIKHLLYSLYCSPCGVFKTIIGRDK